jgi:hypothetical protein
MKSREELSRRQMLDLMMLLPAVIIIDSCNGFIGKNSSFTPTKTVLPSITPKPTFTITATNTLAPTDTPSPTAIPKPTSTNTPVNPAQLIARSLKYETCQNCTLIKYQGSNLDSLLVSQEAGVLGYYSYENKAWKSTKGWKEAIGESKGTSWSDYFSRSSNINSMAFMSVTDGEMIREPFEIVTKDGEILATSKVSIRSFYLDSNGDLQSVIIPQLLQLKDGRLHLPVGRRVDWSEEEIRNQIKSSPHYFNGGTRGFVTWAEVTLDIEKRWPGLASLPEEFRYYYLLINQFNKSNIEALNSFIQTGDPSIGILFPSSIGFGRADDIVKLP